MQQVVATVGPPRCFIAPNAAGVGPDIPTDIHVEVLMGYGEFNTDIWAKYKVMDLSAYDIHSPWFSVFQGLSGVLGVRLGNLRGATNLKFIVSESFMPVNVMSIGN